MLSLLAPSDIWTAPSPSTCEISLHRLYALCEVPGMSDEKLDVFEALRELFQEDYSWPEDDEAWKLISACEAERNELRARIAELECDREEEMRQDWNCEGCNAIPYNGFPYCPGWNDCALPDKEEILAERLKADRIAELEAQHRRDIELRRQVDAFLMRKPSGDYLTEGLRRAYDGLQDGNPTP